MIGHDEARALALQNICDPPPTEGYWAPGPEVELVILDEHTIERSWGWMFFFNSKEYVETGDIQHALAGNAPMIVERESGRVIDTGTADSPETYTERYEATGDPHQRPGREVVVERVEAGAFPVLVARHLHQQFGLSLVGAKQALDAVAGGVEFLIQTPDPEDAAGLCAFLGKHGFEGRQLPELA